MNKRVSFGAKPGAAVVDPDNWVKDRLGTDREITDVESTPVPPAEPTKRLTFDIPKSLHARIKSACAAEERFMNEEIIKLLEERWPIKG